MVEHHPGQPAANRPSPANIDARRGAILIVENDQAWAELMQACLLGEGYVTWQASSGAQAISMISQAAPQLMLLDHHLPDMDGERLLQTLASQRSAVPFVVVSSHGSEALAVAMMKQGARDYLVKDVSLASLLPTVVAQVLRQLETEDRLAKAEDALRASYLRYHALSQISPVGIAYSDAAGNCIEVNDRWSQISGRPRESAWHDGWLTAVHPDDRQRVTEQWRSAVARTGTFHTEYRFLRNDATVTWVVAHAIPEVSPQGEVIGFVRTITDITSRKLAEEALRRHALTLENLFDAVVVTDLQGNVLDWSPAAERMFGYSRAEMLGKPVTLVRIGESGAKHVAEVLDQIKTSGRWSGEIRFVRKDGSQGISESIIVALRDERDQPQGTLCVTRDVTARRQAEEQARQDLAQLAHVNRVSTMGEIVAELAHEINQPLFAIGNFAEASLNLLQRPDYSPAEPLQQPLQSWIRKISDEASRAAEIIRRLGRFVRKTPPQRSTVDLNRLVRNVVDLLEIDFRAESVNVSLSLADDLPSVIVDAVQIEQVLVNLLRNAVEAMRETPLVEREIVIRTAIDSPGWIDVLVRDTGPGVADDQLQRLFEPYFTTKSEGMGMGLAISQSILQDHRGKIYARPNSSRGMEFGFLIPVHDMHKTA